MDKILVVKMGIEGGGVTIYGSVDTRRNIDTLNGRRCSACRGNFPAFDDRTLELS